MHFFRIRILPLILLAALLLVAVGCSQTRLNPNGQTSTDPGSSETTRDTSGETSEQNPETTAEIPKLRVAASFYPMFDFAKKIGGDRIDVVNLVPSGAEPHSWEPAAADLIVLEKADLFIYNGANMEHWVDSVLSAVQNPDLVVVETTAGIDLLAGHDHDHEHAEADDHGHDEDSHLDLSEGETDPHVWLDPMLAARQMHAIKEAFVLADPEHAEYFESNYQAAYQRLVQLDTDFHDGLANLTSRDIIVAHAAYGYLAAAYDLNQIAISGLSPEQEPNPARMAEIIDLAQSRQIRVIFFEELVSPKVVEVIADAIDAKVAVLSPIGGLTDEQYAAGDDYFSIMYQNLETLRTALR